MNEHFIKDLLTQVGNLKNNIDIYNEESIESMKHGLYDAILNHMGIENDLNAREDYYEVLFKHEVGILSKEGTIDQLLLLTSK